MFSLSRFDIIGPKPTKNTLSEDQIQSMFNGTKKNYWEQEPDPVEIKISKMHRNGTINFEFNKELIVPDFEQSLNLTLDRMDPLKVFNIKYVLKSQEEAENVNFNVSFLNWTSSNLTLMFEFESPNVISTGIVKDDLYIQYRMPQLFRAQDGANFTKPKEPYITQVNRPYLKSFSETKFLAAASSVASSF